MTAFPRQLLRHVPVVLATSACAVILLGSALLHPTTRAIGGPLTEAPAHLWGLWTVADGLFRHGPFVRVADVAWPEGFSGHLMDPVNLLAFLPAYWLAGGGAAGAVLGWNTVHLAAVVVGAAGTVRLARRWLDPSDIWPLALAVLVFCGSPFLLATPVMGRSEFLPAALYPLHLSFLHRWMRRPPAGAPGLAAPPSRGIGLLAGLTLGGVFLGGGYLVVFAGILEIAVGLWWARGLPWREAARRLAVVAGIAALCLAPLAISLAIWPSSQRIQTTRIWEATRCLQGPYPSIHLGDVLRLSPGRMALEFPDQPPYVGLLPLLLGLLGTIRRRPGALPWLLVTLLALAFAAGPWLLLGQPSASAPDEATCLKGPVWWLLRFVPPLRMIHAWSRMAGLAALPAAMAAGLGLAALLCARTPSGGPPSRLAWLAPPVLLLALADQGTWPRVVAWPPATFEPAMPAAVASAAGRLAPGPVLLLPLQEPPDGRRLVGLHSTFLLWQLQLGRPITTQEPTERTTPLVRFSPLVGALDDYPSTHEPGRPHPLDATLARCARGWAADLREAGLAGILVYSPSPSNDPHGVLLTRLLGPPAVDLPEVAAWDLALLFPDPAAVPRDPHCPWSSIPPRSGTGTPPPGGHGWIRTAWGLSTRPRRGPPRRRGRRRRPCGR